MSSVMNLQFLLQQHHQTSCSNEQGTDDDFHVDRLLQEEESRSLPYLRHFHLITHQPSKELTSVTCAIETILHVKL